MTHSLPTPGGFDAPARRLAAPDDVIRDLEAQLASGSDAGPDDLEDLVRRAVAVGDADAPVRSQYVRARLLLARAEYRGAQDAARLALAAAGTRTGPLLVARLEALLGEICLDLGEWGDAERHLQRAIERVRHGENTDALQVYGQSLNLLGGVLFSVGRIQESLLCFDRALEVWRSLGDARGQTKTLTNLASIQSSIGNTTAAIHLLNEAFSINSQGSADPKSEATILLGLARAHWLNQDLELCVTVGRAALEAARASKDGVLEATSLLNLGYSFMEVGDQELAALHVEQGMQLSRTIGFRSGEMSGLDGLGKLRGDRGDHPSARAYLSAALDIALELAETQGELESRLHLAEVELALGNLADVEVHAQRALVLAREGESPKDAAEAHRILAELAERLGEYRVAYGHAQERTRIKDELFNIERDRQTRNLSIQFEVERARHEANVYRVRTEVEQDARRAAEQLVQDRTAELAQAHHEVVTRLAMAAEYRDDTTGEHTRRVGRAAARIARALGWPEDRARVLGVAARLHDVGKIGIPDSILLKTGKLTVAEYEQMKSHTLIGSRILSGGRSDLLRMAEEIALSHHERWDGTGYPYGLQGEHVPVTGRIVALADVFDALTQDRPYKSAWTVQEALEEIRGLSGTQFDPAIVDVALRVLVPADDSAALDEAAVEEEDAAHMLSMFEQLQLERTREVEEARLAAERGSHELERVARTDALTCLPNRRAFEADLEVAVQGGGATWVLSCDVNDLKVVNDTRGYHVGDRVLREFAGALGRAFAGVGRAYRIGGDEFAVIGPCPQLDGGLLARVRAALRDVVVEGAGDVTASVGVARTPVDAVTAGDLLRESDRRMYADKVRGRGALGAD